MWQHNQVTTNPIHLLIRYADSIADKDTIAEHQTVIEQHGEVWFGKFGSTIGSNHINRINSQVEDGISSYLYLIRGGRMGKFLLHRAAIKQMAKALPKKQRHLVPDYYGDEKGVSGVGVWFLVTSIEEVSSDALDQLYVVSSGMNLAWALKKSMSGKFVVADGPGFTG